MRANKYDVLGPFAAKMIKIKARQLVGKYGFTDSDREDIEQEFSLHLVDRLQRYAPQRDVQDAAITQIINNVIATMVESRKTLKRGSCKPCLSLDDDVSKDHGTGLARSELISRDEYLERTGRGHRTEEESADLRLDVQRAVAALPTQLRCIAILLSEYSVSDASQLLGVPRTTLDYRRKLVREELRRRGLRDYL